MNLLLVLEHHFFQDLNGDIWCDRVINRNYIERYLNVYENVTICGRIKHVDVVNENYVKISGDDTNFMELPYFKGAKGLIKNLFKIISIFKKGSKDFKTIIFRAPSPLSIILYRFTSPESVVGVEFVMGADNFFNNENKLSRLLNNITVKEAQKLCLKANGVSYVTEHLLQKKYPSYSIKYQEDNLHFDTYYSTINLQDESYYDKKWKPEDKPTIFNITHIGYMDNDRKGHEILLKALKKIISDGYNANLTFIGDGKLMNHFKKLAYDLGINEHIDFYGATNTREDIIKILRETHLFVLPSKSEGLPRAIIEAMATSTPCIGSNVDGIPELLDENCLVKSFEPVDYANKIEELLSDWDKMMFYSKMNYNKSKKFHSKYLTSKRNDFYSKLKEISLKYY